MKKNKLVVILGPTACGKTKIATVLAYKYNGEIVSADSRQVYTGMDIGTGKDLADYNINGSKVSYHVIDVVEPATDFNVAKYQKLAYQAIDSILTRGKVPFLVGGTGLYIDAVTKNYQFNEVTPKKQEAIRKKLDKWSLERLLKELKSKDPDVFEKIDQKNRRRVQRALEIFLETGESKKKNPLGDVKYDILFIGVKFKLEEIYKKIDSRLDQRLDEGMIDEIKNLRTSGVSWQRLDDFGLEYRYVARYLNGQITHNEMMLQLKNAIHHFAKRQLTWFKRNNDIIWVPSLTEAHRILKKFLK